MRDYMADSHGFLGSYAALMIGLVSTLAGAAGVGLFLTVLGEGAPLRAVLLAGVTAVALAAGVGLLSVGARRRGGLLRARVSGEERAAYRREHRRRGRARRGY